MAYLLALSLILSLGTVNIGRLSAAETADGGEAESVYAGGNGTAESPYLVSTAAALRAAAEATNNKGVYYKLTNDIYINGDETTDWSNFDWDNAAGLNEWFGRWGLDEANQFNGNFNGCGYTVYGIYYKESLEKQGGTRCALFPVTGPNAVISNVIISESFIQSNYSAGSVIGETTSNDEKDKACVSGCYAGNTVIVKGYAYAGGIVGTGQSSDFNNCGFTGTVSTITGSDASGIMGNIWSLGTMNNCYAVGYQLSANMNNFWPASNIYSTVEETVANVKPTVLTADQMKGTDAIDNMAFDRLDWDFRYNDFPVPAVRAEGYASGDGTENNPYIIENKAQLKLLVNDTDTSGKYYNLANNITVNESLEDAPELWFMAVYNGNDAVGATFNGNLDGDGHMISGIFYNGAASGNAYWASLGLIPRAGKDAVISNIGLTNSSLTLNGGTAGSVVGLMWNDAGDNKFTVNGCFADETVSVNGTGNLGGITGRLVGHGVISNCYFIGSSSSSAFNAAYAAGGWGQTRTVSCFYTTSSQTVASDVYYDRVYTTGDAVTVTVGDVSTSTVHIGSDALKGAAAVNTLDGFDFGNTWRVTDEYPTLLTSYRAQRRAAGLWDGSAADAYNGGSGTEADPYIIATAEQLRKLVTDTETEGKYYTLTTDIRLNDETADNWADSLNSNEWVTLYNGDTRFKGTFNGGGHNISGLLYRATAKHEGHRAGLFPVVGAGALITNFSVSDSEMSVGWCGGAAAGYTELDSAENFPKFSYIDVRSTVNITGTVVGGVLGGGSFADFDNCCVTAELSGRDELADTPYGTAGDLWGIGGVNDVFYSISNSYVSKYSPYNINHGLAKLSNVYAASYGTVNVVPSVVNTDAMNKLPNLNWKDVWSWDGEGAPYLKLNASGEYNSYALGDTDCDGTVGNSKDLAVMRKHLLGVEGVFAYNADLNEDGTVDIRDFIGLKKSSPVA